MIRNLLFFVAVVLLVGGLWLATSPTSRDRARAPSATDRQPALDEDEVIARLADLGHDDLPRQRAAETLLRLLLHRSVPIRVRQGDHHTHQPTRSWIESNAPSLIVPPLLRRFEPDRRPADAHELLVLLDGYAPQVVRDERGEPLVLSSLGAGGSTPLTLARRVLAGGAQSAHAIYQLAKGSQPLGSVLTIALLTELGRDGLPDATRSRIIRTLDRVSDSDLSILVRTYVAENPRWRPPQELTNQRLAAADGGTLFDWSRADADDLLRRREEQLGSALRSSNPERVLRALERFRWNPVPALDSLVLDLARRPSDPAVTQSALAALAAVPTRAAATLLLTELEKPDRLDICSRVLASWAPSPRLPLPLERDLGAWDYLREPVEYEERWQWCRARLQRLAAESRHDEVDRAFRAGTPVLADFEALPLLASRGELAASWYDAVTGPQLARTLADPDPALRHAAIRALAPWERGNRQVLPHLVDRVGQETDANVSLALLDAILLIGGRESYEAVARELVQRGRFHGLSAIEVYGLLFPTLDREQPLLALSATRSANERAIVSYLIAGLTPTRDTANYLLAGLESSDPQMRFWSCETLRRQYRQRFDYDPSRNDNENRAAIERWRSFVTNAVESAP